MDSELIVYNEENLTNDTTVIMAKIIGDPEEPLWNLVLGYMLQYEHLTKIYIDCSETSIADFYSSLKSVLYMQYEIMWDNVRWTVGWIEQNEMEKLFQAMPGPLYGIEFINPCDDLAELIRLFQTNDASVRDRYLDDTYLWAAKYLFTITYR
jgi:hypothetical protein